MPRLLDRRSPGPHPSALAARIKAERVRLGLTQMDVAGLLGVGRHSYRQLEVTANPQCSKLVALVRVVGMDLRVLLPELFEGP